jgi:bifunctional DNA-binding transcriptional regulator/antitoxin component of YhaV-PrlF toxin-antitoxin module
MSKTKVITLVQKVDSSLMWNFVLPISKEIARPFITEDRRVICTINSYSFQCALIPDGTSDFYIMVNKELRNKLKLKENQEIEIIIEKDTSKYGIYLPPEFEEILNQDGIGSKYFHELTIGKQRSLLHVIGKIKSSGIRINKGLILINYLKEVQGKLDFKELNEAFKRGF